MTKRRTLIGAIALVAIGAAVWMLVPTAEEAAVAGGIETASLSDHAKYITGSAPLNLRLMALEKLRKRTDSGVVGQLDAIAKGSDTRIAVFATSALGRMKTAAAKAKLKALLETTSLDTNVRIGALSAIAQHWKDQSDRSYLAAKADGNSRLEARLAWLEAHVYGD